MIVADPSMTSAWSLLQTTPPTFLSQMDANKLSEARMLIGTMDQSRLTVQDEDGDT